jgi:hypothetical protein
VGVPGCACAAPPRGGSSRPSAEKLSLVGLLALEGEEAEALLLLLLE